MAVEDNTNEASANEGLDPRSLSIQGSVDESTVVVGDRNTINQGPSYYTTNVFEAFKPEQFPARPSQQLSQDEYRWRQVLVQNVKRYWIEGVLEKSLHNQVLIELGLEEREQAVAAPIGAAEEFVEDTGRPFPPGTQATDIFDGLGAGRTLLILGEPGAGKTTMLLKLTKMLITRIGDDFSQSIPVVLNLSSWAKKRQPIDRWLVQDLYETFQVSKALGTAWIQGEQLTLCLDGLDEVAAEYRNDCVHALNEFLQSHGRTEVVVCSRIHDYEALSERLKVKCAIYVQPLTEQQIDRYLEQAGEQLSALKAVLSHSPEIKAFAASPLILSVMSLVCQGCSLDEFSQLSDAKNFRQQLFGAYAKRMLQRRDSNIHPYSNAQAQHWLVWMAQRMIQTSQMIFFIENTQPSWFQTRVQRLWYRLESSLLFGVIFGVFLGVPTGLSVPDEFVKEFDKFTVVASYAMLFGIVSGCINLAKGDIEPVEIWQWSWKDAKNAFRTCLLLGSAIGLFLGLTAWLSGNIGPVSVLFLGLTGLFFGIFVGILGGIFEGIFGNLRGPRIRNKTMPNQGIRRSARNAGVSALCFGLLIGLYMSVVIVVGDSSATESIDDPALTLNHALYYGWVASLFAGLTVGGSACIRHFSLRLMLYRMGHAPWNYAHFLDYAVERIFLQKVGGGYIFIHRMLLEHFAQLELEPVRKEKRF